MSVKPGYYAINPKSGAYLREATAEESAAYEAQPRRSGLLPNDHLFFRTVRVGPVLVDFDEGKEPLPPGAQGGWEYL